MSTAIDISLAIQACIALEGTRLGSSLAESIHSEAQSAKKEKSAVGIRKLFQLCDSHGKNDLLPFSLDSFDINVATILVSQSLFSRRYAGGYSNEYESNHARIFSAWSMIKHGYAWISGKNCTYLPDSTFDLPHEGTPAFELRPALRGSYAEEIKKFTELRPMVHVDYSDTLKFILNIQASVFGPRLQCRSWLLGNSDRPHWIQATRLQVESEDIVTLEFLRSEDILQLSAAAMRDHWLHIQSDQFDVVFPVPDITSNDSETPLWARATAPNAGYLVGDTTGKLEIPTDVAQECVKKFWWLTFEDKNLMIRALSEENDNNA